MARDNAAGIRAYVVIGAQDVERGLDATLRRSEQWLDLSARSGIPVRDMLAVVQLIVARQDGMVGSTYSATGLCGSELAAALRRAADEIEGEKIELPAPGRPEEWS